MSKVNATSKALIRLTASSLEGDTNCVSAALVGAVVSQFSDAGLERIADGDLVVGLVDAALREPGSALASLPEAPTCVLGVSSSGVALALAVVSNPAAQIFLEWTDESSARKALDRLDGFDLRVLDRRPENASEQYSARKARWMGVGRLSERCLIPLDEFDEYARDRLAADLAKTDPKWERFGFAVTRNWSPDSAIDEADELPKAIAAQVRLLLPVRAQIASRARQAKSSKPPAMERAPWREPG